MGSKSVFCSLIISILAVMFLGVITGNVGAKTATSITCDISSSSLTLGDGITVSGEISPGVVGVEVILSYTKPDGTTSIRKTETSLKSWYMDFFRPDVVGLWNVVASWTGNEQFDGATSSRKSFTIVGLPTGTSKITCITDSSSMVLGGQIKIYGAIVPRVSASVIIEVSVDDVSWSTLATVTSGSDGSYSYTWTPSLVGSYSIRSKWLGNGGVTGSTSNEVHATVHGAEETGFNISANPSSRTVDQGLAATFTVTLVMVHGFNQSVSLSVSGLPDHTTGSFNPASVSKSASSKLTVSTSSSTPPGTYTLTITGSGPGETHSADVTLNVETPEGPSKCLIATAAFGSELASEVQFLRNFRDDLILSTFAGKQFTRAFNLWYYSFSPQIADYLAKHPIERDVAKVAMYPLIPILRLSKSAYHVFDFSGELGACGAGLVASSLIGLAYLTPILTVILYAFKRAKCFH